MLQEKSAGVILVASNGIQIRYLLLHYGGGHWGFPKGNIEAEESALQAAIREAEEETGLTNVSLIDGFKEKIEYRGMKDVEVNFPLIEDITMEVAKKYGMIQPGEDTTKAVRAVFFIDPKGIIRTIIYYPLSLGRNFDEIYRALIALQTSDAFNVATPADWRPGDDVIISPAGSCGVAKDRMDGKEDMECQDWFFCTKKIDKDKILDTILKK